MNFKQCWGLLLALTVLVVSVGALLIAYYRVRNIGRIRSIGIGVYSDPSCTTRATEIDWGFLEPGDHVDRQLYFKNERTVNFTISFSTGNWTPSVASSHLNLTWDYTGVTLNPEDILPGTLTLTASFIIGEANITDFSFDITFYATEQS